ncbi:Cytochrome protein, partial [Ophiophagus hannah]
MSYLPGPHKEALASIEVITSFAKQEIENHKESHSLHEPQDFIDHHLLQMEKDQKKLPYTNAMIHVMQCVKYVMLVGGHRKCTKDSRNDPDSTYNEDNLIQCIFDIIFAGTDTTLATLMWALLLLTNHPAIQEKVKKEIEDVLGFSGSISYQDQKKLPYTNAVIHEMQRVKYVFLAGVPRQTTKDVKMRGYHIPKVRNMVRLYCSSPAWKETNIWQLDRNKDGKFIDREDFLPFGIGQRACVGQQLARIEIFIFLTSLLRTFSFQLPEGVKELNEEPVVKVAMHPHPYKLFAIPTQA